MTSHHICGKVQKWRIRGNKLYFFRPEPLKSDLLLNEGPWKLTIPKKFRLKILEETYARILKTTFDQEYFLKQLIVYYVPRRIMRVITRRATMLAGHRSRGAISLSKSRNYPNCVNWRIFYFM